MNKSTKVRIVVIDGLDWEWCSAHLEAVDNLWKMDSIGCMAPLRACDPPVTTTAVAALLAGRDVPIAWGTGDRYSTSQEIIRTSPWLYELARHGLTVGLCNVPLTWPAFPVPKGSWVVSGYPVPTCDDTRRPWRYPMTVGVSRYPIKDVVRDSIAGPGGDKNVEAFGRLEFQIVDWLMTDAPRADVEIVWLRSTDAAGHHHWGTEAYTEAVYHADQRLRDLAQGTETLIVCSDHGMAAVDSPRCAAYMATEHGPTTKLAGLRGGHTEVGIFAAAGERIHAHGLLPEQRLLEVAGGLFDILQLPPPPGMISKGPAWATTTMSEDEDKVRASLRSLGYLS